MSRPQPGDFAPAFQGYIDRVPETDILAALDGQVAVIRRLASCVPRERETFAYAPGKWSIRQVVGHVGDGERVFAFRALGFSRFDKTPLPAFDENAYVDHARFHLVPLAELTEELAQLRSANVRMFRALADEQWAASGVANGKSITVRALAFVMVGHLRHHLHVLRERYDVDVVA
ncbi:MAG TPA: DinB family protein [Candidatus Polarisedimenticolia bacterium]|nr:DinB family protein [Candidatus Polarisedimenticolia bacterium]